MATFCRVCRVGAATLASTFWQQTWNEHCDSNSETRKYIQPTVPYPEWDSDWDGLKDRARHLRDGGIPIATRHIILIRHGQYDETHKEDELRTLTSLGRAQAQKTGERLREIFAESESPICLRCSTMTRAKETCEIISHFLPQGTKFLGFDPGLAEGRPAQPIPGRPFQESVIDVDGPRIEAAFRSLFYRSTEPTNSGHNFDIVVCHGNVIRYFVMRALQLPPEAWLRLCTFNCSLTYIIIRPSGSVSLRSMGDVSHLPVDLLSFSSHRGIEW